MLYIDVIGEAMIKIVLLAFLFSFSFYSTGYSHTPTKAEMVGKWEGMLVSDSFVTPRSQIFDFNYNGENEYNMHYNFANLRKIAMKNMLLV